MNVFLAVLLCHVRVRRLPIRLSRVGRSKIGRVAAAAGSIPNSEVSITETCVLSEVLNKTCPGLRELAPSAPATGGITQPRIRVLCSGLAG